MTTSSDWAAASKNSSALSAFRKYSSDHIGPVRRCIRAESTLATIRQWQRNSGLKVASRVRPLALATIVKRFAGSTW
jgi:hypothetical protein